MSDPTSEWKASEGLPGLKPATTRADRLRRFVSRRALLIYAAAAVVIAAAVLIPVNLARGSAPCSDGLVAVQEDGMTTCVGITDGSAPPFDKSLSDIEGIIHNQNEQVAQKTRVASVGVAVLEPMTLSSASSVTRDGVLHELEGAATAQYQANNDDQYGDSPLIKLYLVNVGVDGADWQPAVAQLEAAATDSRHVVAVAGMGISADTFGAAASELSRFRMAMFAATLTADTFNGVKYAGLVRVAPTNTDEVKAAIAFLPPADRTALLVQDTDSGDDYVKTWATEVQSLYPVGGRQFVGPPETFDRTLPAEANLFVEMSRDAVCPAKPSVIFFAGRAKDLELFTGALGANCNVPVTVVSGDDAVITPDTSTAQDYSAYQQALKGGRITLYSTALADPNEWQGCGTVPAGESAASNAYTAFVHDYGSVLHEQGAHPTDDYAMMARDAVMTAVQTIRLLVGQSSAIPSYQEVTQNLSALHDNPINGVSGVITISNSGPNTGDTVGKPLAVVQHQADGTVTCRRVVTP